MELFDPLAYADDDDEGKWYDAAIESDAAAEDDSQRFTIRDDNTAEWALRKIAAEKARIERLTAVCDYNVQFYTARAEAYKQELERRTGYLRFLLEKYFDSVEHRETKTQEAYDLPSGKLVRKHHAPAVERDDDTLADWCLANGHEAEVEYRPRVDWTALKKVFTVTDSGVYTEDGEAVPGITLTPVPDTFDVVSK